MDNSLTAILAALGAALASPALLKLIDVYRQKVGHESTEVTKLRADLRSEWLSSREELRKDLALVRVKLDECTVLGAKLLAENAEMRAELRRFVSRLEDLP